MIEKIADDLIGQMTEARLIDKEMEARYVYVFICWIEKFITVGSIIVISLMFHKLLPTIFFLVFFLELRKKTGGYHLDKFYRCYLASIVSYLVIVIISEKLSEYPQWLFAIVLLAITGIGLIGTANHPNMHMTSDELMESKKSARTIVLLEGCIILGCVLLDADMVYVSYMAIAVILCAALLCIAKIFKQEVTDLQRRNAKAVNFGIVYGISSFGLSQDLSISKKEAAEYIERYFETYPKIKTFLDGLVEDAKKNGYVTTMFGRRRPVPELSSSNFMQRSFGERVAMNAPIQGTAADIIKIAMIRVHDRLLEEHLKSRLIITVHDELLIETAEDEIDRVKEILTEGMQQAADLKVALAIDLHTGKNWYEAK